MIKPALARAADSPMIVATNNVGKGCACLFAGGEEVTPDGSNERVIIDVVGVYFVGCIPNAIMVYIRALVVAPVVAC